MKPKLSFFKKKDVKLVEPKLDYALAVALKMVTKNELGPDRKKLRKMLRKNKDIYKYKIGPNARAYFIIGKPLELRFSYPCPAEFVRYSRDVVIHAWTMRKSITIGFEVVLPVSVPEYKFGYDYKYPLSMFFPMLAGKGEGVYLFFDGDEVEEFPTYPDGNPRNPTTSSGVAVWKEGKIYGLFTVNSDRLGVWI